MGSTFYNTGYEWVLFKCFENYNLQNKRKKNLLPFNEFKVLVYWTGNTGRKSHLSRKQVKKKYSGLCLRYF